MKREWFSIKCRPHACLQTLVQGVLDCCTSELLARLATLLHFLDVLLTVKLSLFILVINKLDAQNLFYNKFISCLYMFRTPCAHRQEVKIVLFSLWYHHTETNELSKINKITKIIKIYEYEHIVVIFLCVLIFIYFNNFSYFSNFRILTCFSVMIPEAL